MQYFLFTTKHWYDIELDYFIVHTWLPHFKLNSDIVMTHLKFNHITKQIDYK